MQKEEYYISSSSGSKLRIVEWHPEVEVRALLVMVHGYSGHIDRYDHLALTVSRIGIRSIGLDLTGHGKSDGKRAYVERFDDYVQDYKACYALAIEKYPDLPVFLFGHSMGAVTTTAFIIKHQAKVQGVILSGIALFVTDSIPKILVKMSGFVSKWWPSLPTTKLQSKLTSNKAESVARYDSDPLIYHGGIRARTGHELLMAGEWIKAHIQEFTAPVLLLHGADDGLAHVKGSIFFNEQAGSDDKTLHISENGYHEVLHEEETPQILELIINWLQDRI